MKCTEAQIRTRSGAGADPLRPAPERVPDPLRSGSPTRTGAGLPRAVDRMPTRSGAGQPCTMRNFAILATTDPYQLITSGLGDGFAKEQVSGKEWGAQERVWRTRSGAD